MSRRWHRIAEGQYEVVAQRLKIRCRGSDLVLVRIAPATPWILRQGVFWELQRSPRSISGGRLRRAYARCRCENEWLLRRAEWVDRRRRREEAKMALGGGLAPEKEGPRRRRALPDANMKLSANVKGLMGCGQVEGPRGGWMVLRMGVKMRSLAATNIIGAASPRQLCKGPDVARSCAHIPQFTIARRRFLPLLGWKGCFCID
jgi:hypothetical protein